MENSCFNPLPHGLLNIFQNFKPSCRNGERLDTAKAVATMCEVFENFKENLL